nr:hypothetical protein [Tanacetum cinerariifolium]
MLSKPTEKTTHVSLASGFISGPSSGVRAAHSRDRQDLLNPGWLNAFGPCNGPVVIKGFPVNRIRWSFPRFPCTYPFVCCVSSGSCQVTLPSDPFTMSLEEFDDLIILDAEPVSLVLEVGSLPKFDMHLHKSSLTETQVKWAAPIAMVWRHHDSSVADPFPKSSEYNASNIAKLQEVVISLCKPPLSLLYVAGLSNAWKHAGHLVSLCATYMHLIIHPSTHPPTHPQLLPWLSFYDYLTSKVAAAGDILPPGSARVTHLSTPAERLEGLSPKTRDMVTAEIPCRMVLDDKEKKKRKAKEKPAANALAVNIHAERVGRNKDVGKEGARKKRRVRVGTPTRPDSEHVSSPTPLNHAKPLETLANEEYVSPNVSASRMENVDAAFANEGHGDNEGGLSRLQTQPSPSHPAGQLHETVEKPIRDKVVPEVEASYSVGRFGNLPFTPQWGLTDSSQHVDLVYAYESCKDVKVRYKECKKELAKVQSAYDEKASAYDHLSKSYKGALTREKSLRIGLRNWKRRRKKRSS